MAIDPSERKQRIQDLASQIRSLSQELDSLLSLNDSPSSPP